MYVVLSEKYSALVNQQWALLLLFIDTASSHSACLTKKKIADLKVGEGLNGEGN